MGIFVEKYLGWRSCVKNNKEEDNNLKILCFTFWACLQVFCFYPVFYVIINLERMCIFFFLTFLQWQHAKANLPSFQFQLAWFSCFCFASYETISPFAFFSAFTWYIDTNAVICTFACSKRHSWCSPTYRFVTSSIVFFTFYIYLLLSHLSKVYWCF